ncbi:2-Cys peroxiredoxin [Companilactobacillus sp. RD055328]|uniref:thiol peroxidase n=1 Tax=Companilactobacillus sp. RD055328 TaxID=2916634 RepID=UPI001FC85BE7|nr:peroxiredoxin [Companilactobacillus sp. RD055328]GKQ43180.1 2-Cys peroxiredoxin [Companilactobacillus sp. RD055328]
MSYLFHNEPVEAPGNRPEIGELFPDFSVLNKDGQTVTLKELISDKPLLLSVVPNIDTRVCSLQTRHFNQEVDGHTEVNFITISTNTSDQQANWCAAENVKNMEMLSDINHDFGNKTGLYVPALGIDLRSVWVVNTKGIITYREILENQSNEPNYNMVLDHLNEMYNK